MITNPSAVLWDMDGTLVDTEPYWMAAERELAAAYGAAWSDEDMLAVVGNGLMVTAEMLQRAGVDMGGEAIVDHLTSRVMEQLHTQGVPFRPGARELLSGLREAGVPTALVTMSMRRMAQAVSDMIGFDAFDVVIAGDDVPRPKPDPIAYLRAAEQLDIDIADAIAIEDSRIGLASAIASGAVSLGVPHVVDLEGVGADEIWPTLAGRTVDDLAELRARHRAGAVR